MVLILLTLVLAFVATEVFGYLIHIVLHSQKIEFLSRNHMIHHMVVYGPQMSMRPGQSYRASTQDRAAVLGIGMEWIAPIILLMVLIIGGGFLLGVPALYIGVFTAASLGWGYFLFGYMHDSMHLKDFWMTKNRFFRGWYLHIRKLHDIHHLHISNDGKMNVNYGICFFFFDRLFGSFKPEFTRFNQDGYKMAQEKYRYILKDKDLKPSPIS